MATDLILRFTGEVPDDYTFSEKDYRVNAPLLESYFEGLLDEDDVLTLISNGSFPLTYDLAVKLIDWEQVIKYQMSLAKRNIDIAFRYDKWFDDHGDYLQASLKLAQELHEVAHIGGWDFVADWAQKLTKRAGDAAQQVMDRAANQGQTTVAYENWDEAVMGYVFNDYATDGICDELISVMKLLMALKYGL